MAGQFPVLKMMENDEAGGGQHQMRWQSQMPDPRAIWATKKARIGTLGEQRRPGLVHHRQSSEKEGRIFRKRPLQPSSHRI
jgi:hypothetical protein